MVLLCTELGTSCCGSTLANSIRICNWKARLLFSLSVRRAGTVGLVVEGPARETVVVIDGSPTVRRRRLGLILRGLREKAGLTGEDVGAAIERSGSWVSRVIMP